MANILIDGYNLIGIAHRDFEKARQDIVLQLDRYAGLKRHSITVVFDGWKNGQAAETKMRRGDVTVIYSSLGEKADSVIKNMLSSATKPWIVVSSDREIYEFARKKYLVALKADEFSGKLAAALTACVKGKKENLYDSDEEEYEDEDEGGDPQRAGKKGNPNKLSKEDKRRIEALKKL
jgi:predicted RNA-binding protein with PIN domain